jgi:hypothetical protein
MDMTARQIRRLVTNGDLPMGEFKEAFKAGPVQWRLAFDRKDGVFLIWASDGVIASIGAGRWSAGGMGLADLRGQQAGEIENHYPLDYVVEWGETGTLRVLKYGA